MERFDAAAADRLHGQVDALALVFESHLPDILARLRPHEEPVRLLAELPSAVELCAERGIPLEVEVPFMAESASMLPETVTHVAESGARLIRIVPARRAGAQRPLDPHACFSEPYIERVRHRCEEAAAAADAELVWEPRDGATFGLHDLPGFCEDAWGRVAVAADGRVTPCVYAPAGELELGQLGDRPLDAIWHGRAAQGLRQAHLSWDYPSACGSCPRTHAPERPMPFVERVLSEHAAGSRLESVVRPLSPGPLAGVVERPTIKVARPDRPVRRWLFAWSAGGRAEGSETLEVAPSFDNAHVLSLSFPVHLWEAMSPGAGYWWALFAVSYNDSWIGMDRARCLVAHRAIPRLKGSGLTFPGESREDPPAPPPLSPEISPGDYEDLVERVCGAVRAVLPAGAVAAVITRGDERLRDLGGIEAWHFPRHDDGRYAGFHPPDGAWAVEHLEKLRAAGAGYLVIPATASWWYEEYPELVAHLRARCDLVLDDREICTVMTLEAACA